MDVDVGVGVAVAVVGVVVLVVAVLVSVVVACLTGAGVGEVDCFNALGLTGLSCGWSRGEVLPLASPAPVLGPTGFSLGKLSVPGLVVLVSLGAWLSCPVGFNFLNKNSGCITG